MRFVLVTLMFFHLCLMADEKTQTSKNLKENERVTKQLNKKLEDLAVDILNNEKNLQKLGNEIDELSKQSKELERDANIQNKQLKTLNAQNQDLLRDRNAMQGKLVELIAKNYALDLPIPQGYIEGEQSFVTFEVLHSLDNVLKDEFYRISKDYEDISKLISAKEGQISKINSNLKSYNQRLAKLEELKKEQEKEISRQKTDKQIYSKKLSDLQKQQDELRKTLAELAIVDKKEQTQTSVENNKDIKNAPNSSVRQLGSSYLNSKVKRYTGKKTIAPLDNFSVKQKFGNFTDPIYNIKIFNENVILRSKTQNATVKSVLNGKIVFAKETNLLQKVIIVEHSNGLHTIYAHLDKIAPTAKVGKNVKKGEVLGRVKNDLTFEVTQEKFHINPLELISLK